MGHTSARPGTARRMLTIVAGLLVAVTSLTVLAAPATAATGSVRTTVESCLEVNGNVRYDEKTDVYVDVFNFAPDTLLYFKVTEPGNDAVAPEKLLGVPDPASNVVTNAAGDLDDCVQLWAQVRYPDDSQQGYDDTENNGNEYKVYVSTDEGFDPAKTDNFKVEACSDDCDPTPASALSASKDATSSFDRTFAWSAAKSANKTYVQQVGGTVNVTYSVVASVTGSTDSNYAVSGNVTVTNPNAVDVTGVTISDDVAGCSITGQATGLTIQPGSTPFGYSCTFGGTSVTSNTATVSWPAQLLESHPLAAGSAQTPAATWDWTTTVPTYLDECVTLTDSMVVGSLGTACVGDPLPKTFTYSKALAVPAHGCLAYPNTATLTTNDSATTATSSASVTVCGPVASGAHTIGFWKTTNGQGLIGTYCAPAGGTSLATYLSGLGGGSGPFAGAAGKNCSQLKTYVTGILSGASATDMNVMLKAQMLATALDVYFSTLGYTTTTISKVKPPSTFGFSPTGMSFAMDTRAVCPMVDNTTAGTASCLGSTPSTNAVLSGVLPSAGMTPQAILSFAATTPSPYSSGVWYGGNRTKQNVLKNVFDQINNQLAFLYTP